MFPRPTLLTLVLAAPLAAQEPDAARRCAVLLPAQGGIEACRSAVAANPRDVASLANLADGYVSTKRLRDALDVRERLVRLAPDSAAHHWELAKLNDRLGRTAEALQGYRAYAALRPQEPRARVVIGWALADLQRPIEALESFREAVRIDSTDAGARLGLGLILQRLRRQEEAYLEFAVAARLRPDDANSIGMLAVAAHETRRHEEAVARWDDALRLKPQYFDSRPDERKRWERSLAATGGRRAKPVAVEATQVQASAPARPGAGGAVPNFTGSGFVVSDAGHVLTNRHVVQGCSRVRVRSDSAGIVEATIVAVDKVDDLALLRAARPLGRVATFRGGRTIRRGENVVAVGFPLAGLLADQVNVTVGQVSALAGLYNDAHMLQMTAPVQQGSSGGPLFDGSGNVVGVVVTKLNARMVAAQTGDYPQNVNFAIKDAIARLFLDRFRVTYKVAAPAADRPPADVGEDGERVTLRVECFN